jgi:2-phosphoglycerate kinase
MPILVLDSIVDTYALAIRMGQSGRAILPRPAVECSFTPSQAVKIKLAFKVRTQCGRAETLRCYREQVEKRTLTAAKKIRRRKASRKQGVVLLQGGSPGLGKRA